MDEVEKIKRKKMEELLKKIKRREEGEKMVDKPLHLTDANFEEALGKYSLLVVDFWAEWCMPCRMIAPIIEELAKEYAGRVVFGKLNVDENPATTMKYGIMSIPTLIVFKNGKVVDKIIGAVPKEYLKARIDQHL